MNARRFKHAEEMTAEAARVLGAELAVADARPRAVMLSGGKTPLPVYDILTRNPVRTGPAVHVLFSDERMVRFDSLESNYAAATPMITALGLPRERVLYVHTGLPLQEAADRYDRDLAAFFEGGGTIPLGLLGLGADGHTASLFSAQDAERGRGRLAVAVDREKGADRVSVTPDLLARVERCVFLVAGPDKTEAVEALLNAPGSTVAGVAVTRARSVEVWIA